MEQDRLNPTVPPAPQALPATMQLNLFNGALRMCGETKLASLAEAREAQFLLTDVWNDGTGAVQACLEQGLWYFAKRSQMLSNVDQFNDQFNDQFGSGAPPNFGYTNAFLKPQDWVRTMALATDPYFNVPLTQASDEAGFIFCDPSVIYLSFVSNDPAYGTNVLLWPQTFILAVEGYLAEKVVWKITSDTKKVDYVEKLAKRLMNDARSKAAMNESAAFFPMGSWLRARLGNNTTNDRGNPNSFYG